MKKLFLVVTLIAIVIAGACLLANSVRKEIDPDIPVLTITTPRDLFSPFMSSMFGFELVVNAPGDPATYTYACDRGAFCTYKDSKVTHQGNNLTTAEKVYWAPVEPVEDGEYVYSGEMDKILITITALDPEKKAIARGTAAIEHDPEGGWFKFTGEAAASQSTDETSNPVQGIKKIESQSNEKKRSSISCMVGMMMNCDVMAMSVFQTVEGEVVCPAALLPAIAVYPAEKL